MKHRIGIGVTSYLRPKHLELWLSQYKKHNGMFELHIADDSKDRKGVAYRKNECLRELSDCDWIFLFDDDCLIIDDNWYKPFIADSIRTGNNSFLKLNETPSIEPIRNYDGITEWNNCGGVMMFLTKQVIEKVGAFDERFGIYGFEHAQMSNRIFSAGLNPSGKYISSDIGNKLIHSLDLQGSGQFKINHKASMPFSEIATNINKNATIYNEQSPIYIPL